MAELAGGIALEGLDGGTPLGFLAGIGLQRVASKHSSSHVAGCRLGWTHLDAWRPVLYDSESLEAIIDLVADDAASWSQAPILGFRYAKIEKRGAKPVASLTPPAAVLRKWLEDRRDAEDWDSLEIACALMCETATESLKGAPSRLDHEKFGIAVDPTAPLDRRTLPTFFDFTSRNAQFLDQINLIRGYLTRPALKAQLTQGLPDYDAPRSMDWDPSSDTPGAIYTGFRRGFFPTAEWLAFRGLASLPVTGNGERLQNTACAGRRKQGTFVWPLWQGPVGPEAVRSLLSYPRIERLKPTEREALGIAAVFQADLIKMADGYNGMFSPARPA